MHSHYSYAHWTPQTRSISSPFHIPCMNIPIPYTHFSIKPSPYPFIYIMHSSCKRFHHCTHHSPIPMHTATFLSPMVLYPPILMFWRRSLNWKILSPRHRCFCFHCWSKEGTVSCHCKYHLVCPIHWSSCWKACSLYFWWWRCTANFWSRGGSC